MSDQTNDRKFEHIRIIQEDDQVDRQENFFDDIQLTHRGLPECDFSRVDSSLRVLGRNLSFPLLISSMTGGEHETIQTINQNLAKAAQHCKVAMAVGSQRVQFTHEAAAYSFDQREHAPDALLIANLGAVQLNHGFDIEHARLAVEKVGADALYFHLNPLQEVIQPEGDTNFSNLAEAMGNIAASLEVPVWVKEVGAGLSPADVELLMEQGIQTFDVAGRGGTSWSRIEHHRSNGQANSGLLFQDWGIPTPKALQLLDRFRPHATLIASGGIRNGVDMAKACILGASLCGMARPFLQPAMESADAVIALIEQFMREFRTAMFLLGAVSLDELTGQKELILDYGRMRVEG
jgi:isopentenyl-diphosphate delta-isomerase